MKRELCIMTAFFLSLVKIISAEETSEAVWTKRPLTLTEAVEIALERNGAILQARSDLEASHGVSMQARSIVIPKLKLSGSYAYYEQNETEPVSPGAGEAPDRRWFGNVRLVQSIYEGGRLRSSMRTARLTREQAVAKYRAVVADTVLAVRTAYFDVQLDEARETVLRSSTELLEQQAADTRVRAEAGLLQKFDVLRADVAVANSRPKLFQARNQTRLSKTRLAQLLGLSVPPEMWEKMSFAKAESIQVQKVDIQLSEAVAQSLANRPEIEGQNKTIALLRERLSQRRGGYKPSVQAFTGYGGFNDDFNRELYGWFVGVQLQWDLFDGLETQGKIKEARAELKKAEQAAADLARQVELQVRSAYWSLKEAREVLESQRLVQGQAAEALRLASSRFAAGEITSLEVVAAQNALTEARWADVQAVRDYNVALANLERAIGLSQITESR